LEVFAIVPSLACDEDALASDDRAPCNVMCVDLQNEYPPSLSFGGSRIIVMISGLRRDASLLSCVKPHPHQGQDLTLFRDDVPDHDEQV
jgi:hypothetical protein